MTHCGELVGVLTHHLLFACLLITLPPCSLVHSRSTRFDFMSNLTSLSVAVVFSCEVFALMLYYCNMVRLTRISTTNPLGANPSKGQSPAAKIFHHF